MIRSRSKCKECGILKEDTEFYISSRARCKECVKAAVRANRAANIEHYRQYDRLRADEPERVAARQAYQKDETKRSIINAAKRRWIDRNKDKRQAHILVGNAVKSGKLIPKPCEKCGKKAHAHHDDYSRPLKVRWFCHKHHRQHHKVLNERARAQQPSLV